MRHTPSLPRRPHPRFGATVLLAVLSLGLLAIPLRAAPPQLETQGNQIVVKATGEPVRLTGVNIPSLEWGGGENLLTSLQVAVDDWKANVIRLPVSGDSWLNSSSYRNTVDTFISQASAMDVYVILDLHHYQYVRPEDVTFWQSAAAWFANDPAVLFGLLNEPHGINWDEWYHGVGSNPGMQDLVDEVRATGADNILLAGGLEYGYKLKGIVEQGYALTDSASGNGIVYDSHVYPWKSYTNEQVVDCSLEHPVLLGEFGHPGGTSFIGLSFEHHSTWVPKYLDWVDTHRLHWTGWSFHPGADPVMISDWNYTPTSYWGQAAKDRLTGYADPSQVQVVGGPTIGTTGTYSDPNSGEVTDWKEGAMAPYLSEAYHLYFNAPTADDAWTGKDLVTPKEITQITYMPRQGYGNRMVGGEFQVSSDPTFSSDVHTIHTVATAPDDSGGVKTTVSVTSPGAYRYIRYLGPDGGYCNVAFLRFYGLEGAAGGGSAALTDGFTDGDYTGWSTTAGTWSVENGELKQADNAGDAMAWWNDPAAQSWTSYTLSADVTSTDNDGIGLAFYVQDAQNYYYVSMSKQDTKTRIYLVENGQVSLLATNHYLGYDTGVTYTLDVTVDNGTFTVSRDGQHVLQTTDTTFTSGSVGLYSHWCSATYFDNVVVSEGSSGGGSGPSLAEDFADGDASGWSMTSGTWSVVGGELEQADNVGDAMAWWNDSTAQSWTDYTLSADVATLDNDGIGLAFRVQDSLNYYAFLMAKESGIYRLDKIQNGTATTLKQLSGGFTTGQTYTLEVHVEGNSITVLRDGSPILTHTDATFSQGSVGLYSHYCTDSTFDNVQVSPTP